MAHIDRYGDYAHLAGHEREGVDYRVLVQEVAGAAVSIVAPHGGGIERGTSELARAIAGAEFNLYLFEGLKEKGNFRALHLTSRRFDEPRCLELVARSATVITLHGCKGERPEIYAGGRDEALRTRLVAALRAAGFATEEDGHHFRARDEENLCNRGLHGRGVQLELTAALRKTRPSAALAAAIRPGLLAPLR